MAPGTLPRPGTTYGPCEGTCAHTDCAATRRMATSACPHCGQPIGYDALFYMTDAGTAHARCEEDRA